MIVALVIISLETSLVPFFQQGGLDEFPALRELLVGEPTPIALALRSSVPETAQLIQAELAIALVIVPARIGPELSQGSGSIVSEDGLVLTSYHVLANDDGILVNADGLALVGLTTSVREQPSEWYIAAMVAADEPRDLAVLRIMETSAGRDLRGQRFPTMSLGDPDALSLGQTLMGLGYPGLGGDTVTLTTGSMAGFRSVGTDRIVLGKTDSELLPGSSGGAMLDATGRMVGVITSSHADPSTQGRLSYFVLLDEAKEVLDRARAEQVPGIHTGWLVRRSREAISP